jgi:hypothetical protein
MKNIKGSIITALFFFALALSAQAAPTINVLLNGVKPLPGDPMSATPIISVTVTTTNTATSVTGRITLDNTTTPLTFVASGTNFYGTVEVTTALADGRHELTIEAFDSLGSGATTEVVPLFVQTNRDLVVQGTPLNYPNPFDPGLAGATTSIAYMLSKAANVTLSIHDLRGTPISRMSFTAGTNGGRAGYNTADWNGRSDSGQVAGNGIYVYLIIADGKVAAKGKLMVLKK